MRAGQYKLGFAILYGRPGSFAFMRTIRARLYLAFGLAAGMTVIGSLFALFAFATIGTTLNAIVFRSMPATVESMRLSQDTSDLVAFAPRLMDNCSEYSEEIWHRRWSHCHLASIAALFK